MIDLKQQFEVSSNGVVFVTTFKTTQNEDGEEVVEHNRTGYHPNSDVTKLPKEVQDVCLKAWTPDVIEAFTDIINTAKL